MFFLHPSGARVFSTFLGGAISFCLPQGSFGAPSFSPKVEASSCVLIKTDWEATSCRVGQGREERKILKGLRHIHMASLCDLKRLKRKDFERAAGAKMARWIKEEKQQLGFSIMTLSFPGFPHLNARSQKATCGIFRRALKGRWEGGSSKERNLETKDDVLRKNAFRTGSGDRCTATVFLARVSFRISKGRRLIPTLFVLNWWGGIRLSENSPVTSLPRSPQTVQPYKRRSSEIPN